MRWPVRGSRQGGCRKGESSGGRREGCEHLQSVAAQEVALTLAARYHHPAAPVPQAVMKPRLCYKGSR